MPNQSLSFKTSQLLHNFNDNLHNSHILTPFTRRKKEKGKNATIRLNGFLSQRTEGSTILSTTFSAIRKQVYFGENPILNADRESAAAGQKEFLIRGIKCGYQKVRKGRETTPNTYEPLKTDDDLKALENQIENQMKKSGGFDWKRLRPPEFGNQFIKNVVAEK